MSKLFTKEEDQFIIDNYGKLTGAEIGRKLGRTKGTIYYRFQVLGLNTKAKRRGDLTGQKFNMLTVFGLYLQELFIARIIFGSCCLSMMISIIFFIIEIQISTKALRLHLSDMDIQFKE